jgi:segregation and condensation protein A
LVDRSSHAYEGFFKRPEALLPEEFEPEEEMMEVESFALTTAFRNILKRVSKDTVHQISTDRISVTDRIYQIMERFQESESLLFEDLFAEEITRTGVVVTFLALLEMARLKMVLIYQTDSFGAIRVKKKMEVIPENLHVDGESIH